MIELILDRCMEDLRAHRATVADCLNKFPGYADELEPLLKTAVALGKRNDIKPSPEFKFAMRAHLLHMAAPQPGLGTRLKQFVVPRRVA